MGVFLIKLTTLYEQGLNALSIIYPGLMHPAIVRLGKCPPQPERQLGNTGTPRHHRLRLEAAWGIEDISFNDVHRACVIPITSCTLHLLCS